VLAFSVFSGFSGLARHNFLDHAAHGFDPDCVVDGIAECWVIEPMGSRFFFFFLCFLVFVHEL
jgi:hypothetical protein